MHRIRDGVLLISKAVYPKGGDDEEMRALEAEYEEAAAADIEAAAGLVERATRERAKVTGGWGTGYKARGALTTWSFIQIII